jgi:hypothetical protein
MYEPEDAINAGQKGVLTVTDTQEQLQMNPSEIASKKKYPLPPQVDFDTWRARIARRLKHGSPELDTLYRWVEHHSAYFVQIGHSELSSTDALLEAVFELTQPEIESEHERRKHDFAATKIRGLLPEIEATIGALKATGSNIVPKGGTHGRRFNNLQQSLEKAANQIRWALIITDRPYTRSADVLSHCILFLASFDGCGVSEPDILALTSLLMKAHGFSDEELEVFDKRSVETGKIRKRIKAALKVSSGIREAQRSFLQSPSGRQSDLSGVFDFPWRSPALPRKSGPD